MRKKQADLYNDGRGVSTVPTTLQNFDSLPDSAYVRLPVVEALYGCSAATVWRRSKDGGIPAPTKLSVRISGWNVGLLRKSLSRLG